MLAVRLSVITGFILLISSSSLFAKKVTLEPSNWGLEEGKACVECHSKSSSGLTHQWKNSAHAEVNVNCLDCHQASEDDADSMEYEGSALGVRIKLK